MNILVTGASGLIGTALVALLKERGHRPVPLRRNRAAAGAFWNPSSGQIDLTGAGRIDAVVHLAGQPVAVRWTAANKAAIRDSRLQGTRLLSEALARLEERPAALVCASAIGYYGNRGDELLDEESAAGTGFLREVVRDWEAAAKPAADGGIRVVHLRFGIVLSARGGALAKMLPVFRLGLGGRVGSGEQYWSWIALEDVLGVIELALGSESLRGPINAVAPNAVTNAEFTKTLGSVLRRPALCPVPTFALRLVFGEMARETLLASARVKPARLLDAGFKFRFPELEPALRHLLHR
jgi:hypothetical protein